MPDSTITETQHDLVDQLVRLTIPIYTPNHPNPHTGQIDCPIKRTYKDGKRYMLRHKMLELMAKYDTSAEDTGQRADADEV